MWIRCRRIAEPWHTSTLIEHLDPDLSFGAFDVDDERTGSVHDCVGGEL